MRSENSIKNVVVTWIGLAFVAIFGYIERMVLANILGEVYLGLNGLLSNVITVLSLAELGVGPAITYSLYKPISENDENQIKALMRLYKNFYVIIGIVVLAIGLLMTPFLPFLIKEMPTNVEHIYLIFVLFVINASVSYFFSYKAVFIAANQRYYLYSANHAICYVIMYLVQIFVLITTRNFIIFLFVMVATTFIENFRISKIADREYPILKSKEVHHIDEDTKKTIKVNVFASIGHNLGNVVLNSTDNIIISKFVGLVETAYYTNYVLLTATLNTFLNQAFSSIVASIGNLIVEGTEEQKEDAFYLIYFVDFWIYSFCSVALFVLASPFITLTFGSNFILSLPVVTVICWNFYAAGMRQACNSFKQAAGLLIQDVHKAYIEAILNLGISIVLAQKLGIMGVLLGTLISIYAVAFWMEPHVLFKYGFKKKPWKYYGLYLLYFLTYGIMSALTYWTVSMISISGIAGFVIDMIVVCIVPNVILLLIWGWTKECRQFLLIMFNIVKKKMIK
ncbi:MAG: hypothetical protein J6O60_03020 [Lachnospiraceae bacterium]|nr:hypothetical protein [Lachnospiraceae bacterium]